MVLSVTMIIPAGLDFWSEDPNAQNFVGSCFVCGFIGGIAFLAHRYEGQIEFRVRETFFLTVMTWVSVSFFAALPFILSQVVDSFTDGVFEAVSALTTTGFSLLKGIDSAPRSLLLWRSILQWLGGLGIMLMGLTLLPFLRIGGMQLFYAEFSDRNEKILPKLSQITRALFGVYLALTLFCAIALWLESMSPFEAICHSMSTISTGGLSTSSEGISHFESSTTRWILSFFMVLSASPLLLLVRMLKGDPKAYFKDTQVRTYLLWLGVGMVFVIFWLWWVESHGFMESLNQGVFQAASVLTTTGFYIADGAPAPLSLFFLFASLVGGCTGSTAGGIKIFRFQIIYRVLRAQMHQLLHPHGVFIPVYSKRNVENQVIASVFSFLAVYLISCSLLAIGFSICGAGETQGVYLAVNVLSNTGVGAFPRDVFLYPQIAEWLAIFGMILGRLEFFTVLIVCIQPFCRY